MNKPMYMHDCTRCAFVGTFILDSGTPVEYDFYWCTDTLILRYGDGIDQYLSTPFELITERFRPIIQLLPDHVRRQITDKRRTQLSIASAYGRELWQVMWAIKNLITICRQFEYSKEHDTIMRGFVSSHLDRMKDDEEPGLNNLLCSIQAYIDTQLSQRDE